MFKKGGFFSVLFLIILIAGLIYACYYLYQYWPREPVTLEVIGDKPVSVQNGVPSKQFYERMRYTDKKISYFLANSCSSTSKNNMLVAMQNLESLTVLEFVKGNKSKSEIKILCSDVAPEAGEENHFVAGEGGAKRVLNSSLYSVILEGQISLFREETCSEPKVATHELLHAIGFDHNNNIKSILYPTLKCDQEIDVEIIDSINRLYSVKSLPDLIIHSTAATKSGRYLNFHIEILNQGLITSSPANLDIYANDEFVEKFEIGAISIGARKIFDVENLRVHGSTNKIKFRVDNQNLIEELDEQNNEVVLQLNSN
jgi:hypothetical protein